jgi:hypothetical protein
VTVEISPTDFTISQNDATIWQSDPANENQPPTSVTLRPGQSVSQSASWDGTYISSPSVLGLQNIPMNIFGDFVVSNPNAPSLLNATFQIPDPLSYTLTTDQPAYQLGEPITMGRDSTHNDVSNRTPNFV